MRDLSVITGIARHSFGAAFVRALLDEGVNKSLIGIDRIPNQDFAGEPRLHSVICDLNPLTFPGGYGALAETLAAELLAGVRSLGGSHVDCLMQFAGTYEFGGFLDHDLARRRRVLGLNLLGTTEVLHAVMSLNEKLNWKNSNQLGHLLVGSVQALNPRAQRSLYAASKAYGLDLSASIVRGSEIGKCIYLALGPIDTAMLHWNHWTAKAKGSNSFFQAVFAGNPMVYKRIFVDCDKSALANAAEILHFGDISALQTTLKEYELIRAAAFSADLGVLAPDQCAHLVVRLLARDDFVSGVYSLTGSGGDTLLKMATFEDLDRKRLFDSVAREVALI